MAARSAHAGQRYAVHPSLALVATWVANLPNSTGKSLDEWVRTITRDGPRTEDRASAWLKSEHGFGTNNARWLAQRAFRPQSLDSDLDPAAYLRQAALDVESQYSGRKAALRPLFEAILAHAVRLGDDVRICPCKTIVPIYRAHVFAQLKAPAATRVELGLSLRGQKPTKRLLDTGGELKGDRITHVLRLTDTEQIDGEVLGWLRRAYERCDPAGSERRGADKAAKPRRKSSSRVRKTLGS